ncbi:MAG TPA: response regulator [Candidatus Binataceae bacterium]|nr:response regulator [Candidatus Binataceae bacterium]
MPATDTILVVDDDAGALSALADILSIEGYAVQTVSNGREALDLLSDSQPPALIILDMLMPVMDGWQFLAEMKSDSKLAKTPVVVVSALDTQIDADAVFSKPINLESLLRTVTDLVEAKSASHSV